jgi:molybdopterin/thiamine biosynthesis adenylyltransferase
MMTNIAVIGAGGVGSYLIPPLLKTVPPSITIELWDGDKYEEKNLDRQLFPETMIGTNKADALMLSYPQSNFVSVPEYINEDFFVKKDTFIMGCVDNNPAKLAILEAADNAGAFVIIGANEYDSAQTYFYAPIFKETPADPRKRFPEILTDKSGNRNKPSCQTEQADNRQLAIFNHMAASYMLHLFWLHSRVRPHLKKEVWDDIAIQHSCNFNLHRTLKLKDCNANT